MNENILVANIRTGLGKGSARKMRVKNRLPAIIYSKGNETLAIDICPKVTTKILLGPLRRNSLFTINIDNDGKKITKTVMMKERQIHPVKRDLLHIDFAEVDVSKPVKAAVPLELFGRSQSVVQGGKLDQVKNMIRVSCLPTIIPEKIKFDVTELSFGSTYASDIPLPEGLSLMEVDRHVVLTIKKPRGTAKDEEGSENEGGEKA
jgi:large subunit ribosomal protein L25